MSAVEELYCTAIEKKILTKKFQENSKHIYIYQDLSIHGIVEEFTVKIFFFTRKIYFFVYGIHNLAVQFDNKRHFKIHYTSMD